MRLVIGFLLGVAATLYARSYLQQRTEEFRRWFSQEGGK